MDPFHHLTAYTNPYAHLLPPSPSPPPPPPLPAAAEPPRPRPRAPAAVGPRRDGHLPLHPRRARRHLSRHQAQQGPLGGHLHPPPRRRLPPHPRPVQVQVEEPRHPLQGERGHVGAGGEAALPFHEEMRRIFAARVERAHALEKKKGKEVQPEDDDGEGEEDEEEEDGDEEAEESKGVATGASGMRRNKKKKKRKVAGAGEGEVEGMLREFMRRQLEMEERWMEAAEAREAERRAREAEWRRAMVALGQERLALVRRWREREEAWRARAEAREERRHQLVAALLAKLGQD